MTSLVRLVSFSLGLLVLWMGMGLADEAREVCWSGWAYRVEPDTLAFKSDRLLVVTSGPVDWRSGLRIELYPLDPDSGQRDPDTQPLTIEVHQPSFRSANGNRIVDDVANLLGSPFHLMLGMTRIGPATVDDTRQDDFLAWACGRARN